MQTEDHDGVRVMTVHAAKGLEFPLVAVADLGRQPLAGFPPALRLQPEAAAHSAERNDSGAMRVGLRLARLGRKGKQIFEYEELQRLADELSHAEERRILHVAMTRAEERLVLSGSTELSKLDRAPNGREPLIGPVLRGLAWDGEAEAVEIEPPRPREGLSTRLSNRPTCRSGRAGRRCRSSRRTRRRRPANGRPRARRWAHSRSSSPTVSPTEGFATQSLRPRPRSRHRPSRSSPIRPSRSTSGAAIASMPSASSACVHGYPCPPDVADPKRPRAADDELTAAELDSLAGRYARGRVVHQLLERSAREDGPCRPPSTPATCCAGREPPRPPRSARSARSGPSSPPTPGRSSRTRGVCGPSCLRLSPWPGGRARRDRPARGHARRAGRRRLQVGRARRCRSGGPHGAL